MYLTQLARSYQKVLAANANTSSFPSKIPTTTEPTNDGVVKLANYGGEVPIRIRLLPYGLSANDDTFSMRVIGWSHIGPFPPPATCLWVPTIITEVACTMGNVTGVAGAPVLDTEFFCDTITIVSEPTLTAVTTRFGTVRTFSPTADLIGWIDVELYGMEKFELTFDQTLNTPTMNALYAYL